MIGRTRYELDLWGSEEHLSRFLEDLRSQGRVEGTENEMRLPDGQLVLCRLWAEVIEFDGKPCIMTVTEDITERRVLEDQLHEAQKLESIGRLAGGVAHDFNNLLTVINGYCEMMELTPEADHRKKIQAIHQAGERAAQLTQQLLAFSRKQVIEPQVIDLNELVREAELMLARVLPETIQIVSQLEEGLRPVMADPGQLHRVLVNLGLNARDAMPEGGTLLLETSNVVLDEQYTIQHPEVVPGPCVLLVVSDTGEGMDEAVRKRIFEPFFTTKVAGKGTGLGLATVYGIVRQSGGWIWVNSEPGEGTSFKIYLPSTGLPLTPAAATQPAGVEGGGETILLVEDQADVRALEGEVLTRAGYHVLEAANGHEALELSAQAQSRIELLVTDVVMPGMSGGQLADLITEQRPEIKVLFTSGYTEDVIIHQGVLKPGVSFLPKPITPQALLAKVRSTLGGDSKR